MLEGLIEIATHHGVRLPSALALSGKAFGQMQIAVGELDPTLDPFSVVNAFLVRSLADRLRAGADPQTLFYEAQKLKLRLTKLLDAAERATGARPGGTLQVQFAGMDELERTINRAGRRLAVAAVGAAALVAGVAAWVASDRR